MSPDTLAIVGPIPDYSIGALAGILATTASHSSKDDDSKD